MRSTTYDRLSICASAHEPLNEFAEFKYLECDKPIRVPIASQKPIDVPVKQSLDLSVVLSQLIKEVRLMAVDLKAIKSNSENVASIADKCFTGNSLFVNVNPE